ncbi:virulence RhuM family protein [Hydrogenovibrio sp. 3SP14C1]|uniref:virulence RhuM family protein n=1 Tax=Hydrogenovibrio sp. 3SP14C1 TaxID=3038774 RepID=UPI0024175272|nr:virulence RhuM family protein [Hydrogenovibrio sp. 3SP14C1]MDG4812025.1 virulence RhuM family protein [Hydrogenovibrio sp. 3SP14C1]
MEKTASILFYTTPNNSVKLEVFFEDETFWLTQKRMAKLFGVNTPAINKHIANILAEDELDESTISKKEIVQQEGTRSVKRKVDFYNLDMIIAVGYRVNSQQATQFRIWATQTLKEFIIKGFVLDDERLKNGTHFGKDYFDELIAKIREIRASERRFYQKITDIYSQCSSDYSPNSPITQKFFKTVQNKLEFAITGMTAPEIIHNRANAENTNMGLQTWKNAPNGKILKTDITVAKNYLTETELKQLERIVTMYLDFAENQAERQIPMKMQDWVEKLDAFLEFNGYNILQSAGKIQRKVADKLAEQHYEIFRVEQDRNFESDFDKTVKHITKKK